MLDQPITSKMLAEKDGAIGRIIFNNPARHNAVSLDMWQAVSQIMDDFNADDRVRVIVLTGAGGKAFVSGADISEFKEKRASEEAAAEYAKISESARVIEAGEPARPRPLQAAGRRMLRQRGLRRGPHRLHGKAPPGLQGPLAARPSSSSHEAADARPLRLRPDHEAAGL